MNNNNKLEKLLEIRELKNNNFNIFGENFDGKSIKPNKSKKAFTLNIPGSNKIFNLLGLPTKYDELTYYQKWWKFYDNCITFSNLMIILLAYYDYEINFSYPRNINAEYSYIRILMITISLISIFCVLKRHYIKNKWKNCKNIENHNTDNKEILSLYEEEDTLISDRKTNFLGVGLIIDIVIQLVLPYPHLDFIIKTNELDRDLNQIVKIEYLFSDFIYLLLLIRSLYVIRACINYSIFSDTYAHKCCKEMKVRNNLRFNLKCLLKIHHINLVIWFFLASVIIFGFMLRIVERPFWIQKGKIEFETLINPLWCILITMLTVGYGDFYPLTVFGKILCFLMSLYGLFISSLIIVCLQGLLELSNDQFLVFIRIIKSRVAVKFIENAFLLRKSKGKDNNLTETKYNYFSMLESYYEFKNMRKESKSIFRSNGLLFYNIKLIDEFNKLDKRLDILQYDIESAKNKLKLK